jgi:hypothetical protein
MSFEAHPGSSCKGNWHQTIVLPVKGELFSPLTGNRGHVWSHEAAIVLNLNVDKNSPLLLHIKSVYINRKKVKYKQKQGGMRLCSTKI